MLRLKLFVALTLGLVLLLASAGHMLADSPQLQSASAGEAGTCAKLANPDRKISIIVEFARTSLQDSKEIRQCYDTLTNEQKAQVFVRVAKKMGFGANLAEEMRGASAQGPQPLMYGSLSIPYAAVGSGEQRTAYTYWVDDGSRCPTGRGTEYNFAYSFSSNVTNPSSLRANSPWNVLVDGAILYYTLTDGGLKAWYDTNSPVITTCVGDTAISTVGGVGVWKDNAAVYKP
jgi:hypothetical protein